MKVKALSKFMSYEQDAVYIVGSKELSYVTFKKFKDNFVIVEDDNPFRRIKTKIIEIFKTK